MGKVLLMALGAAGIGACSIQRYAINSVGDVLAAGDSVFEQDNDPQLVAEALPFSLKLIESLIAEQPEHRGLLLAAARGYLLYSYAFVHLPAEQARLEDIERAIAGRQRARNLYLRAHAYASRALALDYPGITSALAQAPAAAVESIGQNVERDVPTLYWTGAALGLAISTSRNEPGLLARLPEVEAMLDRALELNPDWNKGALHEVAINLASSAAASLDEAALEAHYERAVELSGGNSAGLHVTYAEAVAIPAQDRGRFTELLRRALAVNVDADPDQRLINVISQQRARWLLDHVDDLFLE